ncbi:MAG: glycosyltransferase family 39 protein, partial [Phycisphaerales bacterium]|nr:glycosyltransferase family 39 protein [Phycisphaerales bacterium]
MQASNLQERRLTIAAPAESPGKRLLFLLIAIGLVGLHLSFSHAYWAPAHYGNNQNAYLVAGKLLATRGTSGFEPQTPWEFVGWMWNMADGASAAPGGGWHYPKYPLGLPVLNAIVYRLGHWLGGPETAIDWTFKVSPVCTAVAAFAVFLITRLLAGSFAGILAMISFSTLTVVLVLMNNPYSHAADVAFVCCGMYALIRWWQCGRCWWGVLAGFLLGFAATIRYTEGLLVLPILAAILGSMRWHRPVGWIVAAVISATATIVALVVYSKQGTGAAGVITALLIAASIPLIVMLIVMIADGHGRMLLRLSVPLVAWAFPLAVLVVYNLLTIGSPTGYDSTNESTGFSLAELQRKWRWGIDQLYNTGLYILLPLSAAGMLMAFRWNWRVA